MSIQFAKMAVCLVGMALAMGSTQSFAKTYYKWVDSQGSTHYTTTPPPKTAKKKGKVDTYGWKNSPPAASPEAPPPERQPRPFSACLISCTKHSAKFTFRCILRYAVQQTF